MNEGTRHTNVRVRPGSALERLLEAEEGQSFTDRLHTLAERFEAVGDVRQALRDVFAERLHSS